MDRVRRQLFARRDLDAVLVETELPDLLHYGQSRGCGRVAPAPGQTTRPLARGL
jgi:hypothetical protein